MLSKQDKRQARRARRAKRRGHMPPAEATKISTRTRFKGWIVTKSITRFHYREKYWENYGKRWGME